MRCEQRSVLNEGCGRHAVQRSDALWTDKNIPFSAPAVLPEQPLYYNLK